jgi:hypothetical protein
MRIENRAYVQTTGGIWANFLRGQGLNVQRNIVGCAGVTSNYGIKIGGGAGITGDPGGVVGFAVIGNAFRFMTAGITFAGTSGGATALATALS